METHSVAAEVVELSQSISLLHGMEYCSWEVFGTRYAKQIRLSACYEISRLWLETSFGN